MRIVYIGIKGLPSKGGAERVVEGLVKELRERHQITVICNSRYTNGKDPMPGIRLVRVPVPPGKHLQPFVFFVLSAAYAFLKGNFDIVHVHNVEASFILPLLRLRFKVLTTSHGSAYAVDKWGRAAKLFLRLMEYPFIRLSNIATSVSLPLAKYYEQRHGRPVEYIPNGIEVELPIDDAAAQATLASYGAPEEGYVLFAAGRIDPTKGCHLLLEALSYIPKDIRIVIVGDTHHAKGYDNQLRSLADERVFFIPFIASKPELFGIVKRCQLFVFPSTVEAMSMMLLEVASLGVPVLWSDIPENKAVMPPRSVSFASGDAKDLSRKLLWALQNPDRMKKISKQVESRVKTNFLWSKIANLYENLYIQLANCN